MKKWFYFLTGSLLLLVVQYTALAAKQPSSQTKSNVVYFYNWTEYVPPGLLKEFTKETGIKVIYSTYDSNESMYAKLKTNKNSGYDLIVPSTYFINKMRHEGMLQKIDQSQLTNFKNIDPALLHQSFDPHNDYSIPYMWGATGIVVDTSTIPANSLTHWSDLWDKRFKNSLIMNDDAREVFSIALRKLGFSGNTRDPAQIKAAYDELKKLMPNVLAFNSDNPGIPFIEGEAHIGAIWNGSAYVAKQSGVPLTFIWPKEGGIFWMDSLAIPKNAQNVAGALKLIDFLLRAKIAANVAETVGYPTPNFAARALLPQKVREDTSLYPSADELKKGEWQDDVGASNALYEEYYQKLKAGN